MANETEKIRPPQTLSRAHGVAQWQLAIVDASGQSRTMSMPSGLSLHVGTHPENGLVLNDATASRVHAELIAQESGVRLRDLSSTNGCWLGAARLYDAVVGAGALLRLGNSTIAVSAGGGALEALLPERRFGALLGQSTSMRALFQTLQNLAASNATVLVQAESGTGKELVARSLHESSERKTQPYVVFDCAAVAPSLFESALFGHEKGAFTGADTRKIGAFEEAHNGTLFLDEIGELPLSLQPRLLRALESREIRRVGSTKPIASDIRLVAATHRDLARGVSEGTFREDLFYRLAVVRVRIPPLRERLEDLRLLVEALALRTANEDARRASEFVSAITPAAWAELKAYSWPGNVRELRNAVERAFAMRSALTTGAGDDVAPTNERDHRPRSSAPFLEQKQQLLDAFERDYLQSMLNRHEGNVSRAAADADIDRMYFKRLLKRHAITGVTKS